MTRHGTERHTTARDSAIRRGPAGRTETQQGPARCSTAKHSTTQHGAPQHTTTPKQGALTAALTKKTDRTPPEGAAPARHMPARGCCAPGNNGSGLPTQTAARRLKRAPRGRRDTKNPTPPNPEPHGAAWPNRPAGRARKGHRAQRVHNPPDPWGRSKTWQNAHTNSNPENHTECRPVCA